MGGADPGLRRRLETFESGAAAWSGGKLAKDNETFKVAGSKAASSLELAAGASATSPSFCVGLEHPTVRMFVRRTGGTWGGLKVEAKTTRTDGSIEWVQTGWVDVPNTGWNAGGIVWFTSATGLYGNNKTMVQMRLTAADGGGTVRVDDVYIDPARGR